MGSGAVEGFEAAGEVVGVEEAIEVTAEAVVAVVVIAFDGGFLDGAVDAFDLAVGPGVVGSGEALPDEATILHFRHLLEKHELGGELLAEINRRLEAQGLRLQKGTIVDAGIMEAPSSLKNRKRERDGEMKQTRKGRQWHFGMKAHIGVDAGTGLVHSVAATGANVADVTQVGLLLHGGEEQVHGDAGYQGVGKRPEQRERALDWQVAMKPGQRRQLAADSVAAQAERRKAQVRAKVEHPFLYVKRRFGYAKVRYRGLAKNRERLSLLFGLANLLIAERYAAA